MDAVQAVAERLEKETVFLFLAAKLIGTPFYGIGNFRVAIIRAAI